MKCLSIVLCLVVISPAFAADPKDTLIPASGTSPVALMGGDTVATTTVSCTSNSTAVNLIAATTNRSRRKVCFENQGNTTVFIGSSTVSASDLFILGESTNSAISPIYCTHDSGAYYCTAGKSTSQTVAILTESASNP